MTYVFFALYCWYAQNIHSENLPQAHLDHVRAFQSRGHVLKLHSDVFSNMHIESNTMCDVKGVGPSYEPTELRNLLTSFSSLFCFYTFTLVWDAVIHPWYTAGLSHKAKCICSTKRQTDKVSD